MSLLSELSGIGPRLTGSTNYDRAADWAARKFREWGLKNVRLEEAGTIPLGFDRGPSTGAMVSPEYREFEFTAPAWSEGTDGPLRGRVVRAPADVPAVARQAKQLKGAWVLVEGSRPATRMKKESQEYKDALQAAGIAGRVYSSGSELVLTAGDPSMKRFPPGSRHVIVRQSDFDAIEAAMQRGEVELEFDLDHKWVTGPRLIINVIADIPGTEKPDEYVVVGGHLDSWDGPGSQGAIDNGVGVVAAMEAARILMKSGARPARTIRFVLFGGEEQGLYGSKAYVKRHDAELERISAVLIDDGGAGYQGGYQGRNEWRGLLEASFRPTAEAIPDLPQEFVVGAGGGGSDHAPFLEAGVPAFFTRERGDVDYEHSHHTQHDRIEYAVPRYLMQSSVNHAVVAYNLACAPSLLSRAPAANGTSGQEELEP